MRLPIILALAVIVLTPANIREIVQGASGDAQAAIAKFLARDTVQVAEADFAPVADGPKTRPESIRNAVGNVR